jgi:nucleoside-diphosphate-sugar epimerase
MKIFLTGATGFIGSHVARILVGNRCEVYALIRPGSQTNRIADILPQLRVVQGSLLEKDSWAKEVLKIKPEMAFHLAWYAEPGKYLEGFENIPVLQASLELAKVLEEAGCKKLLCAGTCFEYDTHWGYLSENTPTKPETLYASCKLALFLVLEQFSRLSAMQTVWLRFFYLYGPFEDRRRLVPMAILSLLEGKAMKTPASRQIKDFLHVEDAARSVWAVAQSALTGAVNIGSGEPVSVNEMVRKISLFLNKPHLVEYGALPPRPWDPPFICANPKKLLENTNWKPKFSLEEGLRHTIAWWEKNRDWS